MRIRARVARTGRQDYASGPEQRDAAEVFAPSSLATWIGTPVVIGHPGWLTVDGVEALAVGFVESVERDAGDGRTEYVRAVLNITDEDTAAKLRRGDLAEFSAGYAVDLTDEDPPRQTNLRINHLGIGGPGWARCGSACSVL